MIEITPLTANIIATCLITMALVFFLNSIYIAKKLSNRPPLNTNRPITLQYQKIKPLTLAPSHVKKGFRESKHTISP